MDDTFVGIAFRSHHVSPRISYGKVYDTLDYQDIVHHHQLDSVDAQAQDSEALQDTLAPLGSEVLQGSVALLGSEAPLGILALGGMGLPQGILVPLLGILGAQVLLDSEALQDNQN